jgi:imidazolonepropionase
VKNLETKSDDEKEASSGVILGIKNASFLYSGDGLRRNDGRHPKEEDLGTIENGAMIYDSSTPRGKILWVGKTSEIPQEYHSVDYMDLLGKRALMPGLVDCHTHIVFAGNRAEEFSKRCAGMSYAEIAKGGGGILTTVRATREASFQELLVLACDRVKESIRYGVRTLEIKSGYGLSLESELKVLKVIQKLKLTFPEILIQATFLGAHDFPKDQSREAYLKMLLEEALPEVANARLADACDVFVDDGFYTLAEGRQILEKAKSLGLKIKLHADELSNTESASLAAEMGALSADHLLKVSDEGIRALAASQTVGVVLPGTAFYLKATQAPAKRMIESGAKIAISTDFNPGTCHSLNLPLMLTISALYLGLTKAELFSAVTFNAASALGLQSRTGTLEVGLDASFHILPGETFEEFYYQF